MSTDTSLERQLHALYAVPVPADLDRRIATALTHIPVRRSGRSHRRAVVALAVAAILALAAAGPAFDWFGTGDDPYARLWKLSAPVDRSVTADGYRITVHRAYADRLGVRLAMAVEDLEGRWSSLEVQGAEMTDSQGRVYEAWNWSGSRTPVSDAIATWARFRLPDEVPTEPTTLRVTVTSLWARQRDPIPLDAEQIFTSVGGAWAFNLDLPEMIEGDVITPFATTTANGITVQLEELGIVPSGTVLKLAFDGLPDLPAGTADGWKPVVRIEHDGDVLDEWELPPGVLGRSGSVIVEATPALEDLAGRWRITVSSFTSTERGAFGDHGDPWVLEFDVPETR